MKVQICKCGRAADFIRGTTPMCRSCGAAKPTAPVDPDVTEADPLLARKREAEGDAFQVLVMDTGHRKARADWREKYADLLPEAGEAVEEESPCGEAEEG